MEQNQILEALEELSRDFGTIAANAAARNDEIREKIRDKIIRMCSTSGRGEEIANCLAAAKNAGRSNIAEERLAAMIAMEFLWVQERQELISLLLTNLEKEQDPKVLLHAIECAKRIVRCTAEPNLVQALQKIEGGK